MYFFYVFEVARNSAVFFTGVAFGFIASRRWEIGKIVIQRY